MRTQPVSQDVVICEWIRAESASKRFKHYYQGGEPDLLSEDMRPEERLELLQKRRKGFPRRFPWHFVQWHEYLIQSKQELGKLRTCKGMTWLALTNGDRLIATAAKTIASQDKALDPHIHVNTIINDIDHGKKLPKMIGFLPEPDAAHPILLEGHARAVSYYISSRATYPLTMFVATSTTTKLMEWDNGLNIHEIRDNFLHHGKEQA